MCAIETKMVIESTLQFARYLHKQANRLPTLQG
jgi:hypothetical protein